MLRPFLNTLLAGVLNTHATKVIITKSEEGPIIHSKSFSLKVVELGLNIGEATITSVQCSPSLQDSEI